MIVAEHLGAQAAPFVPRHRSFCWRCGHPPTLHGAARGDCKAMNCRGCHRFLPVSVPPSTPPAVVGRWPGSPAPGRTRTTPSTAAVPSRWRRRPRTLSLAGHLRPDGHATEPHQPHRFRLGSHGAAGRCSYFRHCGADAVVDSHDAVGRRRALCERHWHSSPVYGPLRLHVLPPVSSEERTQVAEAGDDPGSVQDLIEGLVR